MFDVAIFTALGWERRTVTDALRAVEPAGPARSWRGQLADGASCLVLQTGMGPGRAAAAAATAPPAGLFLCCGCAGGLVDWLDAGDLLVADGLIRVDATGRPAERLPAASRGMTTWAERRGLRVHAGALASSPIVLDSAAKVAAATTGALAVEMESSAIAAAARTRGIPFFGLRVVLDRAADHLPPALDVIDEATGEVRAGRALAAIAPRPWIWPLVARLARQQRLAVRALDGIIGALDLEAFTVTPEAASAAGG
jgi:adenosylhomocysteine nucleosidase